MTWNTDDMTWTCHVCGAERPDALISVRSHEREVNGISLTENVRFCNDRLSCRIGAETYSHMGTD